MYICNINILYYILYIPGCNADNMGYLTIFNVIFSTGFLVKSVEISYFCSTLNICY